MYDLLHKHKRIAQLILALISLPFAFFGVDYYFRSGDTAADVVATYKGGRITQAEFTQSLRDQQENLTARAAPVRSGDVRQSRRAVPDPAAARSASASSRRRATTCISA